MRVDERGVPFKVIRVVREKIGNPVKKHGTNYIGIMNLFTFYRGLKNEFLQLF